MDDTLAKVLSAVLLFVLTMVFSCIPYLIIRRGLLSSISPRRRDVILGYLNCFAGGVFLATFLCHILAEGGEEFEEYKEKSGLDTDFPLFNVFVACGLFLVALIELVAQRCMRKPNPRNRCAHGLDTVHEINDRHSPRSPTQETAIISFHPDKANGASLCGNGVGNSCYQNSDLENSTSGVSTSNSASEENVDIEEALAPKPISLRAFMLLIALSFHTIFDGLAVGLQTSVSDVWVVFAAIAIHKSVIALCIGFEIFQNNLQKPLVAILSLFIFAIMSPVGVGIGIGLTTGDSHELARLLASSVLQGLAGGTFMYVTFLEILNMHIGHHSQGNFLHVFFAFLGFALMALTKLLDRHH